jgi:hypothetical protein
VRGEAVARLRVGGELREEGGEHVSRGPSSRAAAAPPRGRRACRPRAPCGS